MVCWAVPDAAGVGAVQPGEGCAGAGETASGTSGGNTAVRVTSTTVADVGAGVGDDDEHAVAKKINPNAQNAAGRIDIIRFVPSASVACDV